ncbi:MAG: serine/threonine-protein kinase, partial [Elusimicrobiota bacterium]
YPSVVLTAGYIFVITKRFFSTEKSKELIEVSQIETNKMLGLSFQGQGMLDLAFEKFRLCPLDGNMKDTLYNLALDFERKRQYNKAVAIYEHISYKDPEFKDIKTKIDVLKKAADGAVFGAVGGKGGGSDATMMMAGSSATPMLGRYEIKKELGKGAMGIVYLGVDPKINRSVAIKTMRFEEGLEEKAMKDQKDRFFREAQAAGNLTHPNIVKIFDAGEEQDIAYIAMELLKGDDLKKWAAKDNLLPVEKTLEYIARSAEALDYAHKNGIVHRDIKPANIMLLDDGTIRVADFGIDRITESSKTATGTVLGTPYYMSPEQIAGKKVDGRADLFSLGVTLYELLTGERPWKGGESIGTLLFQITSDPYPDPLLIRTNLPPAIAPVIEKALKKKPEERFQTGGEMAEAIRAVMAGKTPQINSIPAPAPQPKPAAQAPAPQPSARAAQPKPAAAQQPRP